MMAVTTGGIAVEVDGSRTGKTGNAYRIELKELKETESVRSTFVLFAFSAV